MGKSEERFAQLLTEGVHRIRLYETKTIQIVQDELGYKLGREGGSAIEYWRKGHIPPTLADIEMLAREIVRRGRMEQRWLEDFLDSADHPYPLPLGNELFPPMPLDPPVVNPPAFEWTAPLTSPAGQPTFGELDSFVVGIPVVHPRHFFGRNHELNRIFGLWRRFPLQNIAVVGPKRSGKTSLLHYLKNITSAGPDQVRPGQRTDWLPQPQPYRWVFVDFQDPRMRSRSKLLHYLLASLKMPAPALCELADFMDIVSAHLQSPVIILMDEIGAALASPELDEQFWWSLRSLGSNHTQGNLAFILTAHKLPWQLAVEEEKPSPFFNIFGHTFNLGPLTETEARELIASSPQPFVGVDIDWILAQSKLWPCLVQIICHVRLAALEFGETDPQRWQEDALQAIIPHRHLLG